MTSLKISIVYHHAFCHIANFHNVNACTFHADFWTDAINRVPTNHSTHCIINADFFGGVLNHNGAVVGVDVDGIGCRFGNGGGDGR